MAENFSKKISCGHCSNISQMKIVGSVTDIEESVWDHDEKYGPPPEQGFVYSVLKCPACSKINIVSYFWHDGLESDDDVSYEIVFPPDKNIPIGLPDNILKAFKAAEKIKDN